MTTVIGVGPGESVTASVGLGNDGPVLHVDRVEIEEEQEKPVIALEDQAHEGHVRGKWLTPGVRVFACRRAETFGFSAYELYPRTVRNVTVYENDVEVRFEDEPSGWYRYSRCFLFEIVTD